MHYYPKKIIFPVQFVVAVYLYFDTIKSWINYQWIAEVISYCYEPWDAITHKNKLLRDLHYWPLLGRRLKICLASCDYIYTLPSMRKAKEMVHHTKYTSAQHCSNSWSIVHLKTASDFQGIWSLQQVKKFYKKEPWIHALKII